jgi:hypothetical protein
LIASKVPSAFDLESFQRAEAAVSTKHVVVASVRCTFHRFVYHLQSHPVTLRILVIPLDPISNRRHSKKHALLALCSVSRQTCHGHRILPPLPNSHLVHFVYCLLHIQANLPLHALQRFNLRTRPVIEPANVRQKRDNCLIHDSQVS